MVRFGLIGTGRMAARMRASLALVPDARVVAVASRSPARAAAFARTHRIPAHGTLDDCLRNPEVDAVYIASGNASHADEAVAAIRAGKAVLCEKPAALSPAEAARVIEAARHAQVLFMEAVCTPFLPAFARTVALARGGTLGRPLLLQADFGYPAPPDAYPGLYDAAGGGVLADRLVYPLVLALAVFGPVARVVPSVVADAAGLDVEASVVLDHAGGGRSVLCVSLRALTGNAASLACERGRVTLTAPLTSPDGVVVTRLGPSASGGGGRLAPLKERLRRSPLVRRLAAAMNARTEPHPYGPDPYRPELLHFCALLRAGRRESDVVDFATTLAVQQVIASVRAGGGAICPPQPLTASLPQTGAAA
ncbi:scyllo-inositol 2-dehydrogenase (NADP(+)) IolU [Methylobacterium crusticola]|uniref:Scyllo-inositol 2-dehydrogenase (NADP(+)) IolU n=1 Tax=Methylobacterium crusticola TaxID=1697972 RepID=A0ABQ4QXK2_9HYPH|nr:Gfo/Idh/MocA family oxidoreductase [Methylobacterium crusticola]GJD49796.1 scyllo-inositol 2-dehydrogenase (NADP(+)) IolU [Methylobacterium crusticola]